MNQGALIFSQSNSPRLQYVVDFLSQYYGQTFKIISDEEKYRDSEHPCKINYSFDRLVPGEIFIYANELLFEKTVRPVVVECFQTSVRPVNVKGLHVNINRPDGYPPTADFEFDILAGIFFLLSRYEEYLPYKKDEFGRFPHNESIAFREGFLHLPLVNIWLEDFRSLLSLKNPKFKIQNSKFHFIPTYDIDIAWSFRNKGFLINAGRILKSMLQLKFGLAIHRYKVIQKKYNDPFDSYARMDELHSRYGLKPVYFFLVAFVKGKHDRNINAKNEEFRQLVRSIANKYEIGLHPSWASGEDLTLVEKEKKLLEEIAGKSIDTSRQHFIRMQLPQTYHRLLRTGIRHEHSMGYGSINGFRASYSNAFSWYDLKNEKQTGLTIHPFCFMDANAYYEQKLNPEQAFAELMQFYEVVKSVNGTMISLWHNSFLGTAKEFEGWREVYSRFIENVIENKKIRK